MALLEPLGFWILARDVSEFENRRRDMRWSGGATSFAHLIEKTVPPPHGSQSGVELLACVERHPQRAYERRCVAPVIFQSWYDLFLPPWLRAAERALRLFTCCARV